MTHGRTLEAAGRCKRALCVLVGIFLACGPVAPGVEPAPAETIAHQAATAALRAAMVETCRLYLPAIDAHPVARVAWAMVCAWPATPESAIVGPDE